MRDGRWAVVLTLGLMTACQGATTRDDQSATGQADASSSTEVTSPGRDTGAEGDAESVPTLIEPNLSAASFEVYGTLNQIYIWDAPPESEVEVIDAEGQLIVNGETDTLGSKVFRNLAPQVVTVRVGADPSNQATDIQIKSEAELPPNTELYTSQSLVPGNNYITMRDGTQLHVYVSLPGPIEDGPYPTVVNYSGYSPAQPGQQFLDYEPLCDDLPVLCDVPSFGAGLFVGLMGYASVGVNKRGTGCSGGAYDYFEPLQLMDGYDIVEIVAAQPWVKHNKVGMVGLSYPGITTLFTAKTQPPSLSAIVPMSVLADSATSTLAPGGIYNDGFALDWVEAVIDRALPYGHGWIQDLVDSGDTVCAEHQKIHGQLVDVYQKALDNPFYSVEVAQPLDPTAWADQITVPVFLTGQWHDEQTGPHFAALFDKFTNSPHARFTVSNGVHIDGFAPQLLMEWKTFMDFFVAKELPSLDDTVRGLVPLFMGQFLGASLDLTPNRFEDYTDFDQALADYMAEPQLRVMWESGAISDAPGAPQATFDTYHERWPLPETEARRWYLHPEGKLLDTPPGEDGGASQYVHDPDAALRTTLPSGDIMSLLPPWVFRPIEPGKAAVFETEAFTEDLVMLGHGSVDLWFKSTSTEADIEVTMTEVRPDGQEMLVQSGLLRATHRTLRADATELRPIKTHLEEDAVPLAPGVYNDVRLEMMPFGHIFRAGSKLRISIDTPGDSTARWFFILKDQPEGTVHQVAHHAAFPSSIVLPIIPTISVETPLPDCVLRGQPCRDYAPYTNTPATD